MKNKQIKNLPASIHQRLLNKARETNRRFDELLQYFAMERFLYRLAKSEYEDRFILKGALMLRVWDTPLSRPTMDIDLLGMTDNEISNLVGIAKDICTIEVEPDGLSFESESITGIVIKEDAEYEGVRIHIRGTLGNIKINLQVDIGFGDVVVPDVSQKPFPTILDFPAPVLRLYSRESTIAEKFEAMIKLESLNSRMKDFFDICTLSRQFDFDGDVLSTAIKSTFNQRQTEIPLEPFPFTEQFYNDSAKSVQWRAFISKNKIENISSVFAEIVKSIAVFLEPISKALSSNEDFQFEWKAPGPWREISNR